ncbi:MAG TPA: twin-arginine translocase TatA/TatE family subunit [Solirubrobacteraceae bacterium]|nr:twin-arginine translocase TatA/TatE family subunit [Solirubrobacteraceae bacterium]
MLRNPTADLLVVLLIVLLFLGPRRLPTLGRQLGHGLREFKDSITGNHGHEENPELGDSAAGARPAPPSGSGSEHT